MSDADGTLEQELAPYRASKGTLKFLLRVPVPYDPVGAVARALDQERTGRRV